MYSPERIKEKAIHDSGVDIDWYFLDKTGKIAVVASGGGMLPDSASLHPNRLKKMAEYFRALPVLAFDVIIEKEVLKKIENYAEPQKNSYLKDLYFMASRGFYYFDKIVLNDYSDFKYYLKAKPKMPMYINTIGENMKDLIPQTQIDQDLDSVRYFFVNEFV